MYCADTGSWLCITQTNFSSSIRWRFQIFDISSGFWIISSPKISDFHTKVRWPWKFVSFLFKSRRSQMCFQNDCIFLLQRVRVSQSWCLRGQIDNRLGPKYTETDAIGDFMIEFLENVIILTKSDYTTWKNTPSCAYSSKVCLSGQIFMPVRKISRLFLLNRDLNKNHWDIYISLVK